MPRAFLFCLASASAKLAASVWRWAERRARQEYCPGKSHVLRCETMMHGTSASAASSSAIPVNLVLMSINWRGRRDSPRKQVGIPR